LTKSAYVAEMIQQTTTEICSVRTTNILPIRVEFDPCNELMPKFQGKNWAEITDPWKN